MNFNDAWFSSTLASIGDAVIATDAEGRVVYMNPVAEQVTRWPQLDAQGKPLNDVFVIINEVTGKAVDDPVHKVLTSGLTVGLANHTVLVSRDGARVPIDDSAAPIRGPSGEIIGVVLVFRDITERRRAQLAKEHLAAIVESSDDLIASKTLDGIITSWNEGAERLLGYEADEIIGQHVSILMPPEAVDDVAIILERIGRGERIDHYQTKRRRKDNTVIDVSLTVSPIRDADQRIVGASKIARDITREKRIEAERLLSERRKDEFLAMLSHELRNPLAAIENSVALYRQSDLEEDREWAIDVMSRQVRQIGVLIEDLLDVSRISQNKVTLHKQTLDAASIVLRAVETTRTIVESRRHAIACAMPEGPLLVAADAARLEQVIVNLITNAARYTEPGGRIWIEAQQNDGDIEIRVRDTGIGIDPDVLPGLFEMFAQGARSSEGLGVGLAIVKSLVELHGGAVTATSAGPGQGSEFVVRLPASNG
jgi:two-component system CheB/CheR fusion protein